MPSLVANQLPYRRLFHYVLLLAVVGLCYSNTLQQEWHFDDFPTIIKSKNIHAIQLSFDELSSSFYSSRKAGGLWRPVANLTFSLNYLYSGLDTSSYHMVNIAIHIMCAFFVYLVFVQTLALLGVKEYEFSGIGRSDIALLGAMLWALHPIQTQAVTYIVQRMASLACLFYMAAMYCYLRLRSSESLPRKIMLLALALVLWVAGVFSKENAALLPLSLVTFETIFNWEGVLRRRQLLLLCLVGIIAFGLSFLLLYPEVFSRNFLEPYENRPFTMYERLLTEPLILTRYLFLLSVPLADFLTLESDIFASTGLFSPPSTFFALLFIFGLLSVAIFSLRKHPLLCFAILFFFINHLVESSFIGLELYFEHRNYLPSIFLYLAASYYFTRLLAWYRTRHRRFMAGLFALLMTVILVSEGNATFLRNEVWETQISLMTDSIEKAPENMRPYMALASELINQGKLQQALVLLEKAEILYFERSDQFQVNMPTYLNHYKGLVYFLQADAKEGAVEKGIYFFAKSLQTYPIQQLPKTYLYLARLLFKTGEMEQAEKVLAEATALISDNQSLFNIYGRVLYANCKVKEAKDIFLEGLSLAGSRELSLNLAACYLRLGDNSTARRIIEGIPYHEQELPYLLYRALLFPGKERNKALSQIAHFINVNGLKLCNLLDSIRNNNLPDIIYPDVSVIEEDLTQAYKTMLKNKVQEIREKRSLLQVYSAKSEGKVRP